MVCPFLSTYTGQEEIEATNERCIPGEREDNISAKGEEDSDQVKVIDS